MWAAVTSINSSTPHASARRTTIRIAIWQPARNTLQHLLIISTKVQRQVRLPVLLAFVVLKLIHIK